jgi:hypothetical protein
MLKAALPELARVTVCAPLIVPTVWIEKVKPAGARLTAGPASAPVPLKLTVWGLPGALSEMLKVPPRVPAAVGVKVTLIVQLAPAATELPQLLLWAKSLASVPVTARLAILRVALPVLVRVTVCPLLDLIRG